MQFIDHTEIFVKSGKGGRGLVSFRTAKYEPKAGADGGDGGFGGNVYLEGDQGMNTLSHLRHRQRYVAGDGEKGGTNNCTGRSGEDRIIPVPVGTIAVRADTEEVIGEVLKHGERILIATGGKRGLGNLRFLTSKHQAPEEFTHGGSGEEFLLQLELKLLADVGFAGFPNAGKSTLLSAISAARPKIADYPFTTMTPQLGVVDVDTSDLRNPQSFVAADIPGLIEGAAMGRGLGLDFLRHLERTKAIAYVIDPFNEENLSPAAQYEILRNELAQYSEDLVSKKSLVAISKMDIAPDDFDVMRAEILEHFASLELDVCFISSATGLGIQELKRALYGLVAKDNQEKQNEQQRIQHEDNPRSHLPKLEDFRLVNKVDWQSASL